MLKTVALPPQVAKYKQTETFNFETVPKGLLDNHSTKAGVWGRLVVQRGIVTYQDRNSSERRQVTAGEHQVIEPETVHLIEPSKDAAFFVEFYKAGNNPVDGPHKGMAYV